jgi:hypothetical protein
MSQLPVRYNVPESPVATVLPNADAARMAATGASRGACEQSFEPVAIRSAGEDLSPLDDIAVPRRVEVFCDVSDLVKVYLGYHR